MEAESSSRSADWRLRPTASNSLFNASYFFAGIKQPRRESNRTLLCGVRLRMIKSHCVPKADCVSRLTVKLSSVMELPPARTLGLLNLRFRAAGKQ